MVKSSFYAETGVTPDAISDIDQAVADAEAAADAAAASAVLAAEVANAEFSINVYIEAPQVKSYPIYSSATDAYRIVSMFAQTSGGTVTVDVEIDDIPVSGLAAVSVDNIGNDTVATANNEVAVDGRVVLDVTAVTGGLNLELTIACLRT